MYRLTFKIEVNGKLIKTFELVGDDADALVEQSFEIMRQHKSRIVYAIQQEKALN